MAAEQTESSMRRSRKVFKKRTAPSLEELLRPGASSELGFLGPTESLEAVVEQDSQAVEKLGLTHQQLADELERVLEAARGQESRDDRRFFERNPDQIPDFRDPGSLPYFSLTDLPDPGVGYLVDGKFQVFFQRYRGFQECPWGCATTQSLIRWSHFDFLLLNRETGGAVTGPGLIVHLIRTHHFFEGVESPYRTDPVQLARTLQLGTAAK